MTENNKQEVLQSLGVVLEHLKQQLSADEAQAIQDKILNDLTARPLDDFSMPRVPFLLEMPKTILARETQISQLTQVIEYVRHTAASDLTDDGIRAYYHTLN
jgi:hypothetical protein